MLLAAGRRATLEHDERSGTTVLLDGAVADRPGLRAALGAGSGVSDAGLVASAFEAWGEAFPERLFGDYAAAVWDGRARRLLLVRDDFGKRPLHYVHVPGRFLAFASAVRSLLDLPEVSRVVDEMRVADYLVEPLECADVERTFFRDVRRVPPAHVLIGDRNGLRRRRTWSPQDVAALGASSAEECDEAFRAAFDAAVRDACGGAATAISLSGGLDSCALAASARVVCGSVPKTISVLSADENTCPEAPFVRALLAAGGLDPAVLRPADAAPRAGVFARVLDRTSDPFVLNSLHVPLLVACSAAERGVRTILSGVDGDLVTGRGPLAILDALRAGAPGRTLLAAGGFSREYGVGRLRALWSYGLRPLLGEVVGGDRRNERAVAGRRAAARGAVEHSLISRELARRTDVEHRLVALREQLFDARWRRPAREHRAVLLSSGLLPVALERLHRVAAAVGAEYRHPFLDRRVVEVCLGVPVAHLSGAEGRKGLLARSMRERVPEIILRRRVADDLGAATFAAFAGTLDALRRGVLPDGLGSLEDWIDLDLVRRRTRSGIAADWSLVSLVLWYNRARNEREDGTRSGSDATRLQPDV